MSKELHDKITSQFIMSLRPILEQPKRQSLGGMMVVMETSMVGVMEILNQLFELKPADCTEMVEEALHQATRRFSEKQSKVKKE